MVLGIASVIFAVLTPASATQFLTRLVVSAPLLLLAYVAFQLVPIPIPVLEVLSPTRAEIASALQPIRGAQRFAPLSIVPAETAIHACRVAVYVLIFLLIRGNCQQSTKRVWMTSIPLVIIGGLETTWGMSQHFASEPVSGSYYSKDHFAGLLEMTLPFPVAYSMLLLSRVRDEGARSLPSVTKTCAAFSLAIGIFFAISLSLSRMAFVSTLGAMFIMGTVAYGNKTSRFRKWLVLAILGVLMAFVFFFVPSNRFIDAFGTLVSGQIHEGRWPIWKDTVRLIAAYPIFGSGLGTYYPALLRYETYGFDVAWLNAHNDYLQVLAELGLTGFALLVVAMIAVFRDLAHAAVWDPIGRCVSWDWLA